MRAISSGVWSSFINHRIWKSRSLDGIGGASIAVMKLFCCQLGLNCHSFSHAFIIHYLNGFDITYHALGGSEQAPTSLSAVHCNRQVLTNYHDLSLPPPVLYRFENGLNSGRGPKRT